MTLRRAMAISALPVMLALGCDSGPKLVEVEGTVKQNGKPLSKIHVEFWPVANGPKSSGTTDDQGKYVLMLDDGKRKGAVVGQHHVILRDVDAPGAQFLGRKGEDVDLFKGKKPRITGAYTDPAKTPIKKDVKAGPNVIDIDVTP